MKTFLVTLLVVLSSYAFANCVGLIRQMARSRFRVRAVDCNGFATSCIEAARPVESRLIMIVREAVKQVRHAINSKVYAEEYRSKTGDHRVDYQILKIDNESNLLLLGLLDTSCTTLVKE